MQQASHRLRAASEGDIEKCRPLISTGQTRYGAKAWLDLTVRAKIKGIY
jgi:hypothetical protein